MKSYCRSVTSGVSAEY